MGVRDELAGRSVGEFVLRERIGEGGFGAVYRCEQPLLGREAVIKVLHHRLRANEVMTQRFLREARLASRLDHPYAAHVYAFGVEKDDGLLWIAMEMVHGTTLDLWLRERGPLPLADLVPFFERIAEVVQTAHEKGIVHRDLKPSNVMVIERAGRLLPKLLDLGIAKLLDDEPLPPPIPDATPRHPGGELGVADTLEGKRSDSETVTVGTAPSNGLPRSPELTAAGAALGSPPYMAPEQWTGEIVGPPADLYALGVLAYEALTGSRPFVASTVAAYAVMHTSDPVPSLDPRFPSALDRFFAHALAKEPASRPSTALELAASFRIASGLGEASRDLPRLDRGLVDTWLASAPQMLAEDVAARDAARNLHQGRDAARGLLRSLLRYLLVVALAARAQVRSDRGDRGLEDLLRGLRRDELDDRERIALSRRIVEPFANARATHPVPELVDLLVRDGEDDPFAAIVELDTADPRALADEVLRGQLARLVAELGKIMRLAAFVLDYRLVVPSVRGAELWSGLRRAHRAAISLDRTVEHPVLVDRDDKLVLALWPLIQSLAPTPGTEAELFVFDGRGRQGARLVAGSLGFERHDPMVWEWFGEHLLDSEDRNERVDEEAPYLGLATFTSKDARRFVGRERETDVFLNRLRSYALQVVVGPSGAGKSSFVNAGVLPGLPNQPRIVTMRPGRSPIATLAREIADLVEPDLVATPDVLAARVDAAARGGIVFVIDQLEELITICQDDDERLAFARILAELAADATRGIRVICTVRDDFLMRIEALAPLKRQLGASLFLLGNPSRDDLVRTIVEPARRVGYAMSDDKLAVEMADTMAGRAGALALLSFTASRLWELRDRRFRQLTRKAYDGMGGVGGALGRHAEATFLALDGDEQRLVRAAFRRLVTSEGTRAQLSVAELGQILGSDRAVSVVDKLVAARLLVVTDTDQGPRIEITHEALLAAWERAQQWIREDSEGARLQDQLRAAARQWDERGRSRGLLWRDDALAELELWRRRDSGRMSELEAAFADASRADAARGKRWRRALLIGALALLGITVVVLSWLRSEADASRTVADENAQRASDLSAEARRKVAEQSEEAGRQALLAGKPGLALLHMLAALDQGARRSPSLELMLRETVPPLRARTRVIAGHTGAINSLSVVDETRVVTAGEDGTARIWDIGAGTELHRLAAPAAAGWVRVDPSKRRVAVACKDGVTRLYGLTGTLEHELRTASRDSFDFHPSFSPDGAEIATVHGREHVVRIWDTRSGVLARSYTLAGGAYAKRVVWSPNGDSVSMADELRDAHTGALRGRFVHDDTINTIAYSADGALVATGSYDRTTKIWDARTGGLRGRLEGHNDVITQTVFEPGGRYVVTASRDHTAQIWDVATLRRIGALTNRHSAPITALAIDAKRSLIATGGQDGAIHLWHAPDGRWLAVLDGHGAAITGLAFAGSQLVSASRDGTLGTWNVGSFGVDIIATCKDPIELGLADRRFVVGCRDGTTSIVSLADRSVVELPRQPSAVVFTEFLTDDSLVTLNETGELRVWAVEQGRTRVRFELGAVTAAAVASDRRHLAIGVGNAVMIYSSSMALTRRIATAGIAEELLVNGPFLAYRSRNLVRTCDLRDGGCRVEVDGVVPAFDTFAITSRGELATDHGTHVQLRDSSGTARGPRLVGDGPIVSVRFDDRGSRLLTADAEGVLQVWNAADGERIARLQGHEGRVSDAAFDARGFVISSGQDSTVRVWDVETGRVVATYGNHRGLIYGLRISADDRFMISSDGDGAVVVRDFDRSPIDDAPLRQLAHCLPLRLEGLRAVPAKIGRNCR